MSSDLVGLLCDRRLWVGPAPCVFALLVLANVGVAGWRDRLAADRLANLTTGDTVAADAGKPFDGSVGERPVEYWGTIPDATRTRLTVVAGMSQLFTVNDRQPADKIIVEWLDEWLAPAGARAFGLAAPNLCNEEAVFLLTALLQDRRTTPAVFLYGNCFDKYRNVDLRPGYLQMLRTRPGLAAAWRAAAERHRADFPAAADKMLATLTALEAAPTTADDSTEGRLRAAAGAVVPAVAARQELNGKLQTELYHLRNAALGIKNTTKRPVIAARYELNRQLFGLLVAECRRAGVRCDTYVIPLNPQADNPYLPAEYAGFRDWLRGAAAGGAGFADLDDLVPADEWGTWLGGPDFKHFRGAAHRRTAARLLEVFGDDLRGGGGR